MATLFGKEIRKLRVDRDVTLRKMADSLNISPSYLSSIETGKRALTDDVRDKMIGYFNLSLSEVNKLKGFASRTNDEVNINLASLEESKSETAVLFARTLEELSEDKNEELLKWLKSVSKEGKHE